MSKIPRVLAAGAALVALAALLPRSVPAHCDTMAGPTVADGRRALESGNANHALKWVDEEHEHELAAVFDLARRVRGLSDDGRELADRYFLETLVRLHRAGEGEPYTGIKPRGTPIDARVAAADQCVATGTLAPLEPLVAASVLPELRTRFERVLATKNFDVNNVTAGRDFVAAYVGFFHLAEAEHAHGHGMRAHGRSEHDGGSGASGHNHAPHQAL